VIVTDQRRRQRLAVGRNDLDAVRLDNQIADGQDETAVVDDDAAAFALCAQRARRARILRRRRAQKHDG